MKFICLCLLCFGPLVSWEGFTYANWFNTKFLEECYSKGNHAFDRLGNKIDSHARLYPESRQQLQCLQTYFVNFRNLLGQVLSVEHESTVPRHHRNAWGVAARVFEEVTLWYCELLDPYLIEQDVDAHERSSSHAIDSIECVDVYNPIAMIAGLNSEHARKRLEILDTGFEWYLTKPREPVVDGMALEEQQKCKENWNELKEAVPILQSTFIELRDAIACLVGSDLQTSSKIALDITNWYAQYIESYLFFQEWESGVESYLRGRQ